jgi:hypothetical protein
MHFNVSAYWPICTLNTWLKCLLYLLKISLGPKSILIFQSCIKVVIVWCLSSEFIFISAKVSSTFYYFFFQANKFRHSVVSITCTVSIFYVLKTALFAWFWFFDSGFNFTYTLWMWAVLLIFQKYLLPASSESKCAKWRIFFVYTCIYT